MKSTREEKKAYAAPRIEFHALVQDIIMCSGGTNSDDDPWNHGGGQNGHGNGGNSGGGHNGGGHNGGHG